MLHVAILASLIIRSSPFQFRRDIFCLVNVPSSVAFFSIFRADFSVGLSDTPGSSLHLSSTMLCEHSAISSIVEFEDPSSQLLACCRELVTNARVQVSDGVFD